MSVPKVLSIRDLTLEAQGVKLPSEIAPPARGFHPSTIVPTYPSTISRSYGAGGAGGVNIADSSKQNQPEAHGIGFNCGSALKEKALELCEGR